MQFAAIPAPSYIPGESNIVKPRVRLLGVESAIDYTSQTQFNGWLKKFSDLARVYNNSPLAQRASNVLQPIDIALKFKGMNGDHTEDQKKTF